MDIRQDGQLLGDFLEAEARALRERDVDDPVNGRFAVAAMAPARLSFGRDQAELLIVTQRRCRHGGALGHLADVDQLTGCHQMGVAVHESSQPIASEPRSPVRVHATDCVTTIVSSTKRAPVPKASSCAFLKLKLTLGSDHRQSQRPLVPYRHYLLASLRAGLFAVAMVVIATVIAACSNSQAEAPPLPPEVDAAQVVTKSVRQWDEFTGRIAAIGAVDIRPRVSGYIDRIAFKEGDMVKAGDLLFVIDPRPYRAAYGSAVAQLERARASAQLAEAQYKRAEALIKTATISVDTYDTRNAALGQTSADVHAAEAARATAKLNLDFTEVRSPIAGRVSRALLTLGNLVQADQTVLTSVVSQDPVYVYFQPDEQSFLRYRELARKG